MTTPRQTGAAALPTPVGDTRYRAAIFALLGAASVICTGLIVARVLYAGTPHFSFLIWNLMLAWVPLGFAMLACRVAPVRTPLGHVVLALSAVVWLLFFPNAPYIVTDFKHLGSMSDPVPDWYDVMLLIWFAWTGLLLGVVSLYLMQQLVERAWGVVSGWVFVLLATGLASLGIYVGRFLRWNSWDVLHDPGALAGPIGARLRDPAGNARLIAFTALFALFFLFVYVSLYVFGRLSDAARAPRKGTG